VGQEPRNGATRGVAPTARAALLHLSSPSIRRSATTLSLGLAPVSTALRTHPQSAIRAGVFRIRLVAKRCSRSCNATLAVEARGASLRLGVLRHKVDKAINPAKRG
jgi:hypothetical protein